MRPVSSSGAVGPGQNLTPAAYAPFFDMNRGGKGPGLPALYQAMYPNGTSAQPTLSVTDDSQGAPQAKPSSTPQAAGDIQSTNPGFFTGNPTHGTPATFQPQGSAAGSTGNIAPSPNWRGPGGEVGMGTRAPQAAPPPPPGGPPPVPPAPQPQGPFAAPAVQPTPQYQAPAAITFDRNPDGSITTTQNGVVTTSGGGGTGGGGANGGGTGGGPVTGPPLNAQAGGTGQGGGQQGGGTGVPATTPPGTGLPAATTGSPFTGTLPQGMQGNSSDWTLRDGGFYRNDKLYPGMSFRTNSDGSYAIKTDNGGEVLVPAGTRFTSPADLAVRFGTEPPKVGPNGLYSGAGFGKNEGFNSLPAYGTYTLDGQPINMRLADVGNGQTMSDLWMKFPAGEAASKIMQLINNAYVHATKLAEAGEQRDASYTGQASEWSRQLQLELGLLGRYGIQIDPSLTPGDIGHGNPDDPLSIATDLSNNVVPREIMQAYKNAGFADADDPTKFAEYLRATTEMSEFNNRLKNQSKALELSELMRQGLIDDPSRAKSQSILDSLGDYNLTDEEYQLAKNRRAADYTKAGEGITQQIGELASRTGLDPMAYAGLFGEAQTGNRFAQADALGQMDLDRAQERRGNQLQKIDQYRRQSSQYAGGDSAARLAQINILQNTPVGTSGLLKYAPDSAANQYALALERAAMEEANGPSAGAGAASGAAQGAAAGSVFGPWGTVIGGVAGGIGGYYSNR